MRGEALTRHLSIIIFILIPVEFKESFEWINNPQEMIHREMCEELFPDILKWLLTVDRTSVIILNLVPDRNILRSPKGFKSWFIRVSQRFYTRSSCISVAGLVHNPPTSGPSALNKLHSYGVVGHRQTYLQGVFSYCHMTPLKVVAMWLSAVVSGHEDSFRNLCSRDTE